MASLVRWLHLSDFHVGKDDYGGRQMFKYIINHVRDKIAERFTPDLLFITGDLANKGLPQEYDTFWYEFGMPLQECIGNDIARRTFTIPGNHDVDRTEHQGFSQQDISSSNSHYFDPTVEGQKLRQILIPRFRAFLDSDLTIARDAFDTKEGGYAQIVDIQGTRVGIAGINTAWLSKGEEDEHCLTPGKGLLEHALAGIAGADLRIVLGHHPLDWLIKAEQKAVRSLLGKSSVVYLHGHLHEAWAEPVYGGGNQFLAVQAGAGFQARESEVWKNGLVWGEADLLSKKLRLQPWRWISDQQSWTLAADAFHEHHREEDWWVYPLPGTESAKHARPSLPKHNPPLGWEVKRPDDVREHVRELEERLAIRFFNGAVPGWHTALSTSIPRRRIVGKVAALFENAEADGRPSVTLVLAASCEGKSTALLQAAWQIVEGKRDWLILHRRDDSQPLERDALLPLFSEERYWLIVIDEADGVAGDILDLLRMLPGSVAHRVHFLLACRDTDWRASGAASLPWASVADYRKEDLKGLSREDASAIVDAWSNFGRAGLGDLANAAVEERVDRLIQQTLQEAKTSEGAFFGALLGVRHGDSLQDHTQLMLERLAQRPIRSGGTLRQAITFVAAMHAEGLEFLSRPVLAQALGCPLERLHRDVLVPLGQEAAATTTSSWIFTRHRRVAEAMVSVLSFEQDIPEVFVSLARAALSTARAGTYVPELAKWRYTLAEHFYETSRVETALRIAEGVVATEPDNAFTTVGAASLYRRANAKQEAVRFFLDFPKNAPAGRGFFFEWSVCESESGNAIAGLLLAMFSLSDECEASRVDLNHAQMVLPGLGEDLRRLSASYPDPVFLDARAAAAVIGEPLRIDPMGASFIKSHKTEALAAGAKLPPVEEALGVLLRGVIAAKKVNTSQLAATRIPDVESLRFDGLRSLIAATSPARER